MRKFLGICILGSLAIALSIGQPTHAATVAYWSYDDSGDIDHDNVGTDNGASSTGVAYESSGMFGGAADFGSTSGLNYISLGSVSDIDNTAGYGLSTWYNSNGDSITQSMKVFHFAQSGTSKLGLALSITDSGYMESFARDAASNSVEVAGTTNVCDDQWHNLMYVFNQSTQTVSGYIDGKLDSSDTNASMGTVSGFLQGRIGRHIYSTQPLAGLLDDTAILSNSLADKDVALIHGLGRLADVTMDSYTTEITAVANAFDGGVGQSATAGGVLWGYASGLGSTTIGTIGGSVAGGNAYIVLDSAGNGVTMVPEPGTFALLAAGLFGLLAYAWRKRK